MSPRTWIADDAPDPNPKPARYVEEQQEVQFQQWLEGRKSKQKSVEAVQIAHKEVGKATNADEKRTAGLFEARVRRIWLTVVTNLAQRCNLVDLRRRLQDRQVSRTSSSNMP